MVDRENGDLDQKKFGLDNAAFELEAGVLPTISNNNNNNKDEPAKGNGELSIEDKPVAVVKERAQWGNGMEFLMSCIAMSVGLGNIWRFPFTAYENGGGAFLIPYIIILTVIGRPLYYLEMGLGQFSRKGNVHFYRSLSPYLTGVGYGQVLGALSVATYYCALMAITIFYLINSFTSDLPWGRCLDEWKPILEQRNLTACIPATATGSQANQANTIGSSEMYFSVEVLKETTDISDGIGNPDWRLTLCLLAAWAIIFLVSVRGVKSSGKASYFLALFPYVVMITLLAFASTLEGASEGMYYFIKTDWDKLATPDVWYAAVTQCFFSLNVGFGSIIMFSSYNDFEHNINRDALIVTTLDTFTSLLSGVTIFGILGNLAYNLGVSPDAVLQNSGGTALAFISYPDAIAKMEAVPWLFAILFFFMLLVLGIGSLVALHATVNTVLHDMFPSTSTWKINGVSAIGLFLIGLMYVTPGGQFMLNLVDYFGGTFIVYVFVIVELVSVCWMYGLENFCLDLEFMLKEKVGIYWRFMWGFITPFLMIIIFIYFCVQFKRPTSGQYDYPDGVLAFGFCILGLGVGQFLLWIVYYIYSYRGNGLKEAVEKTFSFSNWGPGDPNRYEDWKKFKEDKLNESRVKNASRSMVQRYVDLLLGR